MTLRQIEMKKATCARMKKRSLQKADLLIRWLGVNSSDDNAN